MDLTIYFPATVVPFLGMVIGFFIIRGLLDLIP